MWRVGSTILSKRGQGWMGVGVMRSLFRWGAMTLTRLAGLFCGVTVDCSIENGFTHSRLLLLLDKAMC